MNYFQKYRFAILTIIILSVIVLSSAGTVLFFKLTHKPDVSRDQNSRKRGQISQFFKKELNLTPEQEKAFKAYRNQFIQNSKVINDSIDKQRVLMIQELDSLKPDSMKLFRIADKMGDLHAELRREIIRNQLRLRSICTPEQIKKLNKINSQFIRGERQRHRPDGSKEPNELRKQD